MFVLLEESRELLIARISRYGHGGKLSWSGLDHCGGYVSVGTYSENPFKDTQINRTTPAQLIQVNRLMTLGR